MRRRLHSNLVAVAARLLATGFLACGCAPMGQPTAEGRGGATRVQVARANPASLADWRYGTGHVAATEQTPMFAKLSGYARDVAVDIGDVVKAGQPLCEIEATEVLVDVERGRAATERARAAVAQARAAEGVARAHVETSKARVVESRASLARAKAELERRRSELTRVRGLAADHAVTEDLLDESRNKFDSADAAAREADAVVLASDAAIAEANAMLDAAHADLDAAQAAVAVAQAETRRAEALAAYTHVVAPFDGAIAERHVDPGHLTVAGPTGTPLFVIVRRGTVTVVADLDELAAAGIDRGDRARIRVQSLGGRAVEAKVTRVASAFEPATGTLRVEIDLPNADGALRPGQYAEVAVAVVEKSDAIAVPVSAVVSAEGADPFCMVVEGGRAHRRVLATGIRDGQLVEIKSGLRAGELVVRENPATLTDGRSVEILEAEPPASQPR